MPPAGRKVIGFGKVMAQHAIGSSPALPIDTPSFLCPETSEVFKTSEVWYGRALVV